MSVEKIQKWADLLLDTGKRNNLMNFRESREGTAEIVLPDIVSLFKKAQAGATMEAYDPKLEDDEMLFDFEDDEATNQPRISRTEYILGYKGKVRKNQVLIYNYVNRPIQALKNIYRKAKSAIEETGVNISYFAFGFINWFENNAPQATMKAPILLAPVSIVHTSSVEPFQLKISDEIIVNPTFAFKLQSEYGITLPEYDEDEELDDYLSKIEEIVAKLKWRVSRECKIGIFSFLKINMYTDLKENIEKIQSNNSVLTIMGENEATIDTSIDESKIIELENVVDADSSQSEAIQMAREGKSFVLQGPPGTGKSQTITNIIAQCLADNKTVLFVSEKLAALNVVYDKLKKAGLDEFCLELHSHKSNKRQVIEELCHTLRLPRSQVSSKATRELEFKRKSMEQLDGYANELHRIRPIVNKSLFSLYEEVASCRQAPHIEIIIPDIKEKTEDYFDSACSLLDKYESYQLTIGADYRNSPWYGYQGLGASLQDILQLKQDLILTRELSASLLDLSSRIKDSFDIDSDSIEKMSSVLNLFSIVGNSSFITPALFESEAFIDKIISAVSSLKALSSKIISAKNILESSYEKDIYKINGHEYYKLLTKQYNGFFARLFSGEYRKIIKQIKLCSSGENKVNYKEAVHAMKTLESYESALEEFSVIEEGVKDNFGSGYTGYTTDFDSLLVDLYEIKQAFSLDFNLNKLFQMTSAELNAKRAELIDISSNIDYVFNESKHSHIRLKDFFDPSCFDVLKCTLHKLSYKARSCLDNIDGINAWCEFSKLLDKLNSLEIKELVDACISEEIAPSLIKPAFVRAYYSQWIDLILHESPALSELSRIPHDEMVALFSKKDVLNFEINKAIIKATLSEKRPSLDMVAGGSAVSILLRESEKKRKQKGIRQLFAEIQDLALTLKPCFLMSPLSVSTFLAPNVEFDVVIFDEASQIFPQDAIGAIYRGKQLIVVGDSKQMPPSNFFTATNDNDEDEDSIADFESILDVCATTLPQKRLKWHYRSRYEQLISFSNRHFYDNDLVTFPSSKSDRPGIGIDYIFADGRFDRATKTNMIEAQTVVDLVFAHFDRYPERSLGVVAFSISQQNLIDKLIMKRRRKDPSYESFFSHDKDEAFFVKNLETVQGDERDTIIFSVAYAKDDQGKLLLNFGPLNRDGGERRLNVAITRAKHNVQLVTSLHSGDIDIGRTKSVGTRLLRDYLRYAENGLDSTSLTVENEFISSDLYFEEEICEFLRSKGYTVDTQLGYSSMKIDIAVKHPDSDDYAIAIECDGFGYYKAKTTRDRERLRKMVLENMGWHYFRIWSTDWYKNKRLEKERLIAAVEYAISGKNDAPLDVSKITVEPINDTRAPIVLGKAPTSFERAVLDPKFEFPKYTMANIARLVMMNHSGNKLNLIKNILVFEAPLSEEWLLKRILHLLDEKRVTAGAKDKLSFILSKADSLGIVRKNGFLYLAGEQIPMLRVPSSDADEIRQINHIAPEELASGIKEILKHNVSVEKLGLYKLISKALGHPRLNDSMLPHLNNALSLIENEIIQDGDVVRLK